MTEKHLHVITFNVPYPADYGGVIDVFYRLKALKSEGVKVHLHCFEYGREKVDVLNEICHEVTFYKRSLSVIHQFSGLPFIVKTRSNSLLLKNLLKDNHPILFEGLHSCYFLGHQKLADRLKIVRSHNIEYDYYNLLAQKTPLWSLRMYFKLESFKLKRFEKVLQHADFIAAISETDYTYFQKQYGKTFLMPPCHRSEEVNIEEGKGNFILYHGNLSVQENEEAALFIVEKIAPFVDFDFIVAGKNPSLWLQKAVAQISNVRLITNPGDAQLQQLIAEAHINLLPTFQATGFKLKLLNALFNGRFCVCTPQLVEGTGLNELCIVAENNPQLISEIDDHLNKTFTSEMIENRKEKLNHSFSNRSSVLMITKLI